MKVVFNHQFNDYIKVQVFVNEEYYGQWQIYKNFPSFINIEEDHIDKVRFSFQVYRRAADCAKASGGKTTASCVGTVLPHQLNRNYHYANKGTRPKFSAIELQCLYDTELEQEEIPETLYLFPCESTQIKGMLYFSAMDYDSFQLLKSKHYRKCDAAGLDKIYSDTKTMFVLKNAAYAVALIGIAFLFVRQIISGNLENMLKVIGMGLLAVICLLGSYALPMGEVKSRKGTKVVYDIEVLNNGEREWGFGADEPIRINGDTCCN
ncbi:hypothetical protein M2140_001151 [Clostridiales Family XIII bacterium PM5-7]